MNKQQYQKLKDFCQSEITITQYGIAASSIDKKLLPFHSRPAQIRDEIPTLNKCGFMKIEWDEFCKEFISFAKKANKPVLEIGSAYGWVTHRALEQDIEIIAADISKEHLGITLSEAPEDKLDKLHLYHGAFPNEIEFPKESLSSVLASRVLHFLNGTDIETGLNKIYEWLEPNGKFICSNCSIFHYTVDKQSLALYRQKEKEGQRWPGQMYDLKDNDIQGFFHVFDIPVFQEVLPRHGFEIEKIKYFDYPSDNYSESRRGHIGFVARKI